MGRSIAPESDNIHFLSLQCLILGYCFTVVKIFCGTSLNYQLVLIKKIFSNMAALLSWEDVMKNLKWYNCGMASALGLCLQRMIIWKILQAELNLNISPCTLLADDRPLFSALSITAANESSIVSGCFSSVRTIGLEELLSLDNPKI